MPICANEEDRVATVQLHSMVVANQTWVITRVFYFQEKHSQGVIKIQAINGPSFFSDPPCTDISILGRLLKIRSPSCRDKQVIREWIIW